MRFESLPVGRRGNWSMNTTDVGHLNRAMRSRQNSRSSSANASSSATGAAGSTTARTASPISASGTPITMTVAHAGVLEQHVLDLAG